MFKSIGEIAKEAGVNPSAIRYYESMGLLPEPTRISGQRRYTTDVLNRILFIKLAQRAGFTVQDMKELLEGFDARVKPSERWRVLAVEKHKELDEKKKTIESMQQVLTQGLQCECLTWEACFMNINSVLPES